MNRLSALNHKLLRDLWHIRGQAVAIAVVIACGVATVVMAFGVLHSLSLTRGTYYDREGFAQVFSTLRRAPLSLRERVAAVPGVAAVDARIVESALIDVPGSLRPAIGRLISLPVGGAAGLNRLVLRRGRLPAPQRSDEVVISEAFANANHLAPGMTLTAKLHGKLRRLCIIGIGLSPEFVYAIAPGQIIPDDKSFGIFWMNRDALEAAFDLDGAFNDLSLTLMHGASEAAVIAGVDRLLAPYGGTGAYGRKDQVSHAYLDSEFDQLNTTGRIIPPIFLGVAAFLLHIVISRLIDTERQQIGLLKSIGYSNTAVGWHYAKLVLAITALGALGGIALGAWLGHAVTVMYMRFFHFPFLQYRIGAAVLALAGATAFLSAAAGMASAVWRSARLPPAVAMRPPPPPVYRRSRAEIFGLARFLTPEGRMVVRHIGRWPLRAGLTTLGIGASVGLIVSAVFMFDAVDKMVDVFYFRAQHQDVLLGFDTARSARAVHEVARLPGALRAEPFRAEPAKLFHENRTERVAIVGLPPRGQLAQLLDSNLHPVAVPAHGLALSISLAQKLGVGEGSVVRAQLLEGARRSAEMRVAKLVEEYVGLSAYMNLADLDAFAGGGRSVSGVRLALDARAAPKFYRRIAKVPAISSVTARTTAVQSFRATFAESMNIVLYFYIGFAAVIAAGVIYNAARISLSERGHELATLRVLGFTENETIAILLAEFAVLTVLALPVGWLFGSALAKFLTLSFATDLFRIPYVISMKSYGLATAIGIAAAIASGVLVARRIRRFDLVAVLKTRE